MHYFMENCPLTLYIDTNRHIFRYRLYTPEGTIFISMYFYVIFPLVPSFPQYETFPHVPGSIKLHLYHETISAYSISNILVCGTSTIHVRVDFVLPHSALCGWPPVTKYLE